MKVSVCGVGWGSWGGAPFIKLSQPPPTTLGQVQAPGSLSTSPERPFLPYMLMASSVHPTHLYYFLGVCALYPCYLIKNYQGPQRVRELCVLGLARGSDLALRRNLQVVNRDASARGHPVGGSEFRKVMCLHGALLVSGAILCGESSNPLCSKVLFHRSFIGKFFWEVP